MIKKYKFCELFFDFNKIGRKFVRKRPMGLILDLEYFVSGKDDTSGV